MFFFSLKKWIGENLNVEISNSSTTGFNKLFFIFIYLFYFLMPIFLKGICQLPI